jgi:tetratricopeptide (TPR) repeat protein
MLRRLLPARAERGADLHDVDADVLATVRKVHHDGRLLRRTPRVHVHQLPLHHAVGPVAIALLASLHAVLLARPAAADANVQDEAMDLQRKAIQEDNLNVAYAEAIRKLSSALSLCSPSQCAPRVRAELLRDLGAMHFLDGSLEEGKSYFDRALGLSPDLSLDRSYSTAEMEKLWAAAKKGRSATARGTDDEPVREGAEKAQAPPRVPRFWVGVWGSVDFAIVPTADQACLLQPSLAPVNTVGYFCTDSQGNDFPSRSDGGAQNATLNTNPQYGDSLNLGSTVGDVRLGLSFDFALGDNVLLGARAAGVLRSYPGQAAQSNGNGFAAPIHLEARVTYVIGAQATTFFAPLVLANAGVGEYDAAAPVRVWRNVGTGPAESSYVNAWAVGGPVFAGAGAGFRVLFDPHVAGTVVGKFEASFGAKTPALLSIAPEIGLAYGFY